jgi:hypothetical protein
MQVLHATAVFTHGTALNLATLLGTDRCAELVVEPDIANGHDAFVGDALLALGTSTVNHVIKTLVVPTSTFVDSWRTSSLGAGRNLVETAQFSLDGTTNEIARVTAYIV